MHIVNLVRFKRIVVGFSILFLYSFVFAEGVSLIGEGPHLQPLAAVTDDEVDHSFHTLRGITVKVSECLKEMEST